MWSGYFGGGVVVMKSGHFDGEDDFWWPILGRGADLVNMLRTTYMKNNCNKDQEGRGWKM
jgi:hypothetical protein